MIFNQAVSLPIPYLPSISWFVKLWSNPSAHLDSEEITDKRRPRNRCVIATAQGSQMLSVPLQGGRNQRVKLSDVRILNTTKWQREHIHAMQTAYGKSPYFEHYAGDLFSTVNKPHEFLVDLNVALIEKLIKQLRIQVTLLKQVEQDSLNSIEPHLASIRYPQVFEHVTGFVPDCSIIDFLFNCGPDAIMYFKQSRQHA